MRLSRGVKRALLGAGAAGALVAGAAVLTETSAERELKGVLGYPIVACTPHVDARSPWQAGPPLPMPLDEPRAVALDGRIYLVGGVSALDRTHDGGELVRELPDVTALDPATGRYEARAPMPEAGNHVGVVTHDGDIYVLGGYQPELGEPAKNRFSRYDPERDRWTELAPMPFRRGAMAVGVIGDRLIVAGGADGVGKETSRADAYDFQTRTWHRIADMPTAREHVGAAVVGGLLYVIGGRAGEDDDLRVVERYDPRSDRWTTLPDMPVGAGGLVALSVDGALVAVGGGSDLKGTVTGAVQRLDPESGRWTRLPSLRTPRHGHAAAVVDGRIHVLGGSGCAYFAATDLTESLEAGRDH
jgi:non-specific serine/threonine protein kinase